MGKYRCNSCQGTYVDPQPDGSPYKHVCSPIRNPAWKDPNQARISHAKRLERASVPKFIERENKRDENLEPATRNMKSVGLGRSEV